MARKAKPSIIFIDEIDSLCGSRSEGDNDSTRRVKTEFLVQMDGVGKDGDGLLVLGATNLPYSLDQAIRRRFQKRIYIPLPDENARAEIFRIQIGKKAKLEKKKDFEELAQKTNGFSGSDISTVVRSALMEPIRTCSIATHFKKVSGPDWKNPEQTVDDLLTACSPSDENGVEMSLNDIPSSKLLPPAVTVKDFIKSLRTSKASVSSSDLKQYDKYTEEFGEEG